MEFIENSLIFALTFILIASLAGVFCYRNYFRKIVCLATAYINLIIILIIFSKNSQKASQLFNIIPTILILFSITLAVGVGIIFNITKPEENKKGEIK